MKSGMHIPEVFVVFECLASLMKHAKQVLELASQTTIHIDLLHVCFIDLNLQIKNAIHITRDFTTGFHWVSKCMHVIWYMFMDWLLQFMDY